MEGACRAGRRRAVPTQLSFTASPLPPPIGRVDERPSCACRGVPLCSTHLQHGPRRAMIALQEPRHLCSTPAHSPSTRSLLASPRVHVPTDPSQARPAAPPVATPGARSSLHHEPSLVISSASRPPPSSSRLFAIGLNGPGHARKASLRTMLGQWFVRFLHSTSHPPTHHLAFQARHPIIHPSSKASAPLHPRRRHRLLLFHWTNLPVTYSLPSGALPIPLLLPPPAASLAWPALIRRPSTISLPPLPRVIGPSSKP